MTVIIRSARFPKLDALHFSDILVLLVPFACDGIDW